MRKFIATTLKIYNSFWYALTVTTLPLVTIIWVYTTKGELATWFFLVTGGWLIFNLILFPIMIFIGDRLSASRN